MGTLFWVLVISYKGILLFGVYIWGPLYGNPHLAMYGKGMFTPARATFYGFGVQVKNADIYVRTQLNEWSAT